MQTNLLGGTNLVNQVPSGNLDGVYWTLVIILTGVAIAGALAFLAFLAKDFLICRIRGGGTFCDLFEISEWLLAVAISAVSGLFGVFSWNMWKTQTFSVGLGFPLWSAFVSSFILVKLLTSKAKKRDAERVRELEDERETSLKDRKAIEEQRDTTIDIVTRIGELIQSKLEWLDESLRGRNAQFKNLPKALDSNHQGKLITYAIHDFFSSKAPAGKQVRVAVYCRNSKKTEFLERIGGWDGKKEDCFKTSAEDLAGR